MSVIPPGVMDALICATVYVMNRCEWGAAPLFAVGSGMCGIWGHPEISSRIYS